MSLSPLQLNSKACASEGISERVIRLLESLNDEISDIRCPMPGADSVEARMACSEKIKGLVDTIKRFRDNKPTGLGISSADN